MEVQAPFGMVTFPDGTDPATIDRVLREHATKLGVQAPGMQFSQGQVPGDVFGARLAPPTTYGRGNPMLAALGVSQIGPVIASQMQPSYGKAIIEQANAQNLALGKTIPAFWNASKWVSYPIRAALAAQGAQIVGQAQGQRFAGESNVLSAIKNIVTGQPPQPLPGQQEGENDYLNAQSLLGVAQTLAAPGLEKPVTGGAQYVADLVRILAGKNPSDILRYTPRLGGPAPQPSTRSSLAGTPPPVSPPIPSPATKQQATTTLFDKEGFRASLKAIPTEQLQQQYQANQVQTRQMLTTGQIQPAVENATRGRFIREEIESREKAGLPTSEAAKTGQPVQEASSPRPFNAKEQSDRVHEINRDLTKLQAKAALSGRLQQFGKDVQPLLTLMGPNRYGGEIKDFDSLEQQYNQLKEKYASSQPSTTRIPRGQQRAGVDEGASLRQQGEVALQKGQEGQKVQQVGQAIQSKVPAQSVLPAQVPIGQPGNARGYGGGGQQVQRPGVLSQEQRNKEIAGLLGKKKSEGGFFRLFGGVDLSRLGLKPTTRVQGEQMYNRIRNVLGGTSGAFQYLDKAGLKGFLQTPKTMQELEQWMTSVEPKVEVRKFGDKVNNPNAEELAQLQHNWKDAVPERARDSVESFMREYMEDPNSADTLSWLNQAVEDAGLYGTSLGGEFRRNALRYAELASKHNGEPLEVSTAHWQSIAPKPKSQMPGYVEIAVVKPHGPLVDDSGRTVTRPSHDFPQFQFPSSHSFPPNTLGFLRGYMETDAKTGEKTFHVIEVQSDWAQRVREEKELAQNQDQRNLGTIAAKKSLERTNDPLLPHYERLALKAAIDHAKKEGATRIAVSDAETAMMTEGHDKFGKVFVDVDTSKLPKDTLSALTHIFPVSGIVRLQEGFLDSISSPKHDWRKAIVNREVSIEQAPGMRLHYDQTLPRILEELTGDKGQRVSFGEHKMAFEQLGAGQDMGRVRRKDLIFKEPGGGLKEDVTARSYDLSKVEPEKFTTFERDRPKGAVQSLDKTRASEAGSLFPKFGISRRASAEREKAGTLPEQPEPGEVMEPEEIVERGQQLLAEGVDPEKALAEATKGGYTGRDVIAVTRAYGEQLAKAASATGIRYGFDSPEYKAARQKDFDWISRIKPLGTGAGEAMRALQGFTMLDTGDFHSMARSYKADTGEDFTPQQTKEAQERVKENVTANQEVDKKRGAFYEALNKLLQQFYGRESGQQLPPRTGEQGAIFGGSNPELEKARAATAKRSADEAAAIWDYARKAYLDQGFKGTFDQMVNQIAVELGTSKKQIVEALYRPKGIKELSDAMYRAMDKRRRVKQSAEAWLQAQKIPGWVRYAKMVPNLFFMDKIFLHGTVLPTTHAAVNLFHPQRVGTWLRSYMQGWKMAYSSVKHEQWVQDQLNKPNYTMWKRAGLGVDPERYYEDYQNAMMQGWWSKMNLLTGRYGADSLKDLRIELANHIWDNMPAELKTVNGRMNREMAKQVATMINHATGVVRGKVPEALNWTFFAPRLEASRWAWLIGDPAKAMMTFANWDKATPEERWFATAKAKEMAWIVGTYTGLLALNQGILMSTGSPQRINFFDPHRSDFMSFKAGGHSLGVIGPMLGLVRLFANVISDSVRGQNKLQKAGLSSRREAILGDVGQYAASKLSPFAGFGLDIASQSDYRGRPLPWSQDQPPLSLKRAGIGKYGYGEYALQQFTPIPMEEAVKEVWMSQGMTKDMADRLWLGLLSGAVTATTGARLTPDLSTEPKPEPHKEPFQIKPPTLRGKKFSMGDILKRGGKQYMVTGFDEDGHPMVDEVGKEAANA